MPIGKFIAAPDVSDRYLTVFYRQLRRKEIKKAGWAQKDGKRGSADGDRLRKRRSAQT